MRFNISTRTAPTGLQGRGGYCILYLSRGAGCQLPHKTSAYREEAGAFEPGREADEAGVVPHAARLQHRVRAQQQSHGQVLLAAVPSVPAWKNTLQRLRQWRDGREHGYMHTPRTHTHTEIM